MKGQKITEAKREAIQGLRGHRTARELAEEFDVSERSVIRIWAEAAGDDLAEDMEADRVLIEADLKATGHHYAVLPEAVQSLTMDHYLHLVERREYYAAMADAYPDNCAWGNLEAKYDKMIAEELRTIGHWYGLDKQDTPLETADLIARSRSETTIRRLSAQVARLPEGLSLKETAEAVLKMKIRGEPRMCAYYAAMTAGRQPDGFGKAAEDPGRSMSVNIG